MFVKLRCANDALSISLRNSIPFVIIIIITTTIVSADPVNITSEIQHPKDLSGTQQLEVQIYYETLCPDSKRFIRYKFYDAMIKHRLFNYTDMKLIPYGKVTTWIDPTTNEENLNCQHGMRECDLNALHACIIENNTKMETLQMIDCLMGGYKVQDCAEMLGIDVIAALECKSSRSIDEILKKYGEETNAIDLWFVPSIGIDGHFDPQAQNNLLEHFVSEFCTKYKDKFHTVLEGCASQFKFE